MLIFSLTYIPTVKAQEATPTPTETPTPTPFQFPDTQKVDYATDSAEAISDVNKTNYFFYTAVLFTLGFFVGAWAFKK